MKLNSRAFAVLAILAIAGAVLLVDSDETLASNMGFKENKQIFPKDGPPNNGVNLVALPFNNPYATSQDICDAINSPVGGTPPACRIVQIAANTGITSTDTCAAAGGAFPLIPRVGIVVDSCTAATAGIIVGSHAPGVAFNLYQQVPPQPKGFNHYPIPFHTTNATMGAVCTDLGLVSPTRIIKINADNGVLATHSCPVANPGPAGLPLVLGESLIIDNVAVASAPVPSHF